jgi:methylmalonyl-CoA mutase N-terminal domain/subunit
MKIPPALQTRVAAVEEKILAHPLLLLDRLAGLVAAVAIIFFVILYGPGFILGIRQAFTDRTIEKQKNQAAAEKTAAEQQIIGAGEADKERQAEDLNRETNLEPERERAGRNLEEARRARIAAEETYAKNRNRDPDPDSSDLHKRNCSDLAELYPEKRFAGCR